jgi:RNA polymerase sigma factor (sigma-70 family)
MSQAREVVNATFSSSRRGCCAGIFCHHFGLFGFLLRDMVRIEAMQRVDINDAELVAKSLEGNRDAFGLIVERYQTLISSLAYCATGNVSRSQDIAQETFVTAWRQLADLREPAKLRSWLCSIARSFISKEFRRQGREPDHAAESLAAVDEWVSPEPLPPERVISDEEKAILWRSLERIPEIYREPLVLFYREHQSIAAVARDLGLSEDAVKQRLSRGRKLLQERFLAFVAGALEQTKPGKAFTLGVIAVLPLLAPTAKAATVGTALAQHGGVAAKTAGSAGLLQAIANFLMGMVGWVAAALPLGGYIGYKMGGDRQDNPRSRRSVAAFWRLMGVGMCLLLFLPPLLMFLPRKLTHLSDGNGLALVSLWMNLSLPILLFGVLPLSLGFWIWRRGRRTVPGKSLGQPISNPAPKYVAVWVVLAMTVALVCLGYFCWMSSYNSASHYSPSRYVSTSEIQSLIANPQVRKFRFRLYQSASGVRTLSGDLLEDRKMCPFVAPAEDSTLALLAAKGIGYDKKIESRDYPHLTHAGWWSERLLNPFCCFILVAGAATLLRGSRGRQFGPLASAGLKTERRVDQSFAALAACGMVALAVFRGATTDWKVRAIPADQVPAIAAQHKQARFQVFQYHDGSRKLWISDLRNPDFIAPANETTVAELTRQGITYQTYVAGMTGFPGPSQCASALWILALTAGAGSLLVWAMKSRPVSPSRLPDPGTI